MDGRFLAFCFAGHVSILRGLYSLSVVLTAPPSLAFDRLFCILATRCYLQGDCENGEEGEPKHLPLPLSRILGNKNSY
jgi:hypothetical protein